MGVPGPVMQFTDHWRPTLDAGVGAHDSGLPTRPRDLPFVIMFS